MNFSAIETKLGFSLHKDLKELLSSYYFYMLEGNIHGDGWFIDPLPPTADLEKYITGGFEKERYAGDYRVITETTSESNR